MTTQFINGIVLRFDVNQYPLKVIEIEDAIPAPSTQLARVRVQLRSLPCDIKATLFARDTMTTWFRMTGVGTPIARIQDTYTLDQTKAIEISCRHKLREYQVGIPRGMTARAALMDHIFKVALRNSTQEEKREMIQAMNRCSSVSHVESLTSRFCSLAIKALKVVRWVTHRLVFQILANIFIACFIYGIGLFLTATIANKMFRHLGVLALIPYFFISWHLPDFAFAVSKSCTKAIEILSQYAHQRADIAYENDQLKRAYITWMNETAVRYT